MNMIRSKSFVIFQGLKILWALLLYGIKILIKISLYLVLIIVFCCILRSKKIFEYYFSTKGAFMYSLEIFIERNWPLIVGFFIPFVISYYMYAKKEKVNGKKPGQSKILAVGLVIGIVCAFGLQATCKYVKKVDGERHDKAIENAVKGFKPIE